MAVTSTIERLTGVHWQGQGPAFLVGLGHAAIHWIAATFYLLLPFITQDLGLTYAEAGALVAVFHLSSVIANFGSGLVVDVTGRRVLFQVVALLVGGGALLAFGGAEGLLWLGALVVLIGGSNNLWHPAAISYVSRRFPRQRGYALSIHALGASLGDTAAPLATGALLVSLTWQGTAAVGALPVLGVAVVLGLFLRASEAPRRGVAERGMGLGAYLGGLGKLVRDKTVLGLCLMAGFRTTTQNVLLVFLPLYLAHDLKLGPLWVGLALTAMQVGGLIATPVAGAWSDRAGRRPVVLAGLSMTTIIIFALTLTGNGLVFIAGISLLGFGLFAVRPVVHSWLMDLTPPSLGGSATSVMFGTQAGLSALVLAIGGLVADAWGLAAVFYMLAGTVLAANLLVFLLPGGDPGARR